MRRIALLFIAVCIAGAAAAGDRGMAYHTSAQPVILPCPSAVQSARTDTAAAMMAAKPVRNLRRDDWFGKDKADHLVVSAFLAGFGYYAARKELHRSDPGSKNIGAGFSLSLGLMKEMRDHRRRGGFFSLKDLGADIVGIGLGYLFCSIGEH